MNSLSEIIGSLGTAAGSIWGKTATKAPSPVAANPSTFDAAKWMPWIAIGGGILLAVLFVASFRKR